MAVDLKEIEEKWIRRWDEARVFEADPEPGKRKFFLTFPFPYMNGPLHIGHAFTSTKCDVYARFKRMQGFNVLFPWAWHLTGEPISGAASRVKDGDEGQIRIFRDIDGVPEEELAKFTDPEYIAKYYIQESKRAVRRLGHSIDWRREFHTTSLHPHFNRFIRWQYLSLKEKGYVIKGTHPVIWCSRCKSPTGDHDRLHGEGASVVEFTILKFGFDGAVLPAATLRPETIFGVVNMWINPDAEYARVKVGSEDWIVSKEAAMKLSLQKDGIEVVDEFKGVKLIGKYCIHPTSNVKVLILPASFVDPNNSTGVVMSVPSHAPYDWIALKDLIDNPSLVEGYGISKEQLEDVKPVSLIKIDSFGEHPAVEICERMGIKDQNDPRAEEATEIIYKEEFYKGVLKENTGKYAGMKVSDVKKTLVEDFEKSKIADRMFETTENVVCRCATPCVVKVLKDQWFLKYSDQGWKALVKEALNEMTIFPDEARANFNNTVDWLEEKACARRSGMGTPLPWDSDWIVETLSDSTVYMAFYTISKHVNAGRVPEKALTPRVFDYVFYGKGDPDTLAEESGLDQRTLNEMREEFSYFMPVDFRNSAKELIPNHLTFFIFQHCALFPREQWPRMMAVNGMISVDGEKMSKSKGNFVTLKQVLEGYGSDATRAALIYSSEGLRDPDWREKLAVDMRNRISSFYTLSRQIAELEGGVGRGEKSLLDRWLMSRMQRHIKNATSSYGGDRTRSAFQTAFFDVSRDVKWYMRVTRPNKTVLLQTLSIWLRLVAPVIPSVAEELWELLGKEEFISNAPWPEADETLVDLSAEVSQAMIHNTLGDVENILNVTKIKPKRIIFYTPMRWKWRVLEVVSANKGKKIGEIMSEIVKNPEAKSHAKEASKYVSELLKEPSRSSYEAEIDEFETLTEFKAFFEKELNCNVEIYPEDDKDSFDPMNKAKNAMPLKPAIYVE